MRIGIDCRLAGTEHAGLGRYTENLILELLAQTRADSSIRWILFFSSKSQAKSILKTNEHPLIKIVIAPIRHYSLQEQLLLPFYFYKERLDLLHIPHFNVPILYISKTVVTIHDLLWHQKRGGSVTTLNPLVYWLKYLFYLLVTTVAITRAHSIFVPAQTVAKTVTRYYPAAKKKLIVTTEGTSLPKSTSKQNRNTHQLLYVGSLYPHKNITLVIDALKKLPQYNLLIVGARNVFQEKVRQYVEDRKLQQQVTFLGYVTDKKLAELYATSAALVQPSLSEGFGLTGIEALAVNTPVIASDIPIFHEIYKQAALYFDPHSVDSFVAALKKLGSRSDQSFQTKALEVVKHYSWNKMATKTLLAYKTAIHAQ